MEGVGPRGRVKVRVWHLIVPHPPHPTNPALPTTGWNVKVHMPPSTHGAVGTTATHSRKPTNGALHCAGLIADVLGPG